MKRFLNISMIGFAALVAATYITFGLEIIPWLFKIDNEYEKYNLQIKEGYIYNFLLQAWLLSVVYRFSLEVGAYVAARVSVYILVWIIFNTSIHLFSISSVNSFVFVPLMSLLVLALYIVVEVFFIIPVKLKSQK